MICVLQFDSASRERLERLLAAGRLGALASLIERGRRHELATPAVDFAAGSFPTLYSGVELGDHGVVYPFQWAAEQQRVRYASAFEAPPAVWERLTAAGRPTLVIDPYEGRPPSRHEGLLVSGWGFSDRVVLPRYSRPRAAAAKLERVHGRAPALTEIFGRPRARDLLRLRSGLLEAPRRSAALAEQLLAERRYELAWITLSAGHLAGHQFWDLGQLDPRALDRGSRRALETALDDVYVAVDEAIGRVLAALPEDADVIVASAVGMAANTSRADLLPEMLARVLDAGPAGREDSPAGAIWRLRAAVPASIRGRLAAALPRRLALELTARLELRGTDWRRTRAFAHPADNQGYVRLNLAGRERDGIVPPERAEALLAEIAAALATFRNADGSAAIESVVRAAELYPGRRAERLPDLVVRWSADAAASAELASERYGTVRRRGAGSGRSGNHTAGDAWALVVASRSEHRETSRPARLVDIAATVCAVTGIEAGDLAGEPLLAPAQERRPGSRPSPALAAPPLPPG